MKGTIKLEVTTPKIQYSLDLERNITVIKDKGATGKSYLCSLLSLWEEDIANHRASDIGVKLNCGAVPVVMTAVRWNEWQAKPHDNRPHILFVDEDTEILTFAFMEYLGKSGDYCVIMSRDHVRLRKLTFSVNSVKALTGTRVKTLVPHILDRSKVNASLTKQGNLWGSLALDTKFCPDMVVLEDSGSGYDFFKHVLGDKCKHIGELISSKDRTGGRSKVAKWLKSLFVTDTRILISADGAAFGGELDYIWLDIQLCPNIRFYLYESFEWLLLHTPVFWRDARIRTLVCNPVVDSKIFLSWERYFTALLVKISRGRVGLAYSDSKSSLPSGYLAPNIVKSLLDYMPEIDLVEQSTALGMLNFDGYTYEYKPLNDCLALFNKNASKMRCASGYYGADKTRDIVFYAPSVRKIYFTKPELQGKSGFRGTRLTKEQVRRYFRI